MAKKKITKQEQLDKSIRIGKKHPEYFYLKQLAQDIWRNGVLMFILMLNCISLISFGIYIEQVNKMFFGINLIIALVFFVGFFCEMKDLKVVRKKLKEIRELVTE